MSRRLLVACAAAALILGPLAWFWQASLLPGTQSAMAMGYPDYGGGPGGMADHRMLHGSDPEQASSVPDLVADPDRPADVSVTLTARWGQLTLPSGRTVKGYSLNGTTPGPVIHATEGQLIQVRLVNESVPDGVTLHWHGVDVPNAADGVAGVTQDAVGIGESYTYRFVAEQVGTFWYHSHQISHQQVRRGLLGALVIQPRKSGTTASGDVDTVALVHQYTGRRTVNGYEDDVRVAVQPARRARVRVINTENGELAAWVTGAPFRVLAVDGSDLTGPTPVRDTAVLVTAGGRADLEVTMPADGSPVRVQLGGGPDVVLESTSYAAPATSRPSAVLDLLRYGSPAPLGFDPDAPDRRFRYDIGRRPGFLNGKPGMWWSINGHLFPDVPMFVVAEGDVVRMRISNHSGDAHPMHLHGHHAVVLARNGLPASGSPWWVDSLNVRNGETYDVAFLADNPGIWMDHCHNLPHATAGLVAHLMYQGVRTPFELGDTADNEPE